MDVGYPGATVAFWEPHIPRILTVDYTFKGSEQQNGSITGAYRWYDPIYYICLCEEIFG